MKQTSNNKAGFPRLILWIEGEGGLLTTSATGTSTFSAAFHVIVIDASGCFLHTGFQFANPVADTKSKAAARPFTATLRQEVYALRMIVIASVLLKYIIAVQVQAQTFFFHERTADPQTIIIITGTFSLQVNVRSTTATIQT